MRFDENFVRTVLPEAHYLAKTFPTDVRFSIDTRTLQPGDIFVALPGAVVDGHSFIGDAFARGAAGVMINASQRALMQSLDSGLYANKLVILVPYTFDALIACARAWRAQCSYPVIAVTGSVGKTSTKQLLSTILTHALKPHLVSHGNYNTKLGVALSIMRMRPEHEVAIFEVGINKRGEMKEVADLLRPTNAIITGIGHAHMAGLGTLTEIAAEKRAIFAYFTESNIGVIHGDQPLLADVGYAHPMVKFGTKMSSQVQARKIQMNGFSIQFIMKLYKKKYSVTLHNAHMGMVYNVLAAAAMAYVLQIHDQVIVEAIQQRCVVEGRFEHKPLKIGYGTLINDCYNANPESMKASLLAFHKIETKAKKIAVIGDMLELGEYAPFWHRQVGRLFRQMPSVQHLILVGDLIQWTKKTVPISVHVEMVPSWKEAAARLRELTDQEQELFVLVKGSQGMNLTNLVQETT